uniref:Uncharacterized protein n=1 Tax=Oryza punctata TaxID=4537 RepID=A0A0E0MLB3_ORYPU
MNRLALFHTLIADPLELQRAVALGPSARCEKLCRGSLQAELEPGLLTMYSHCRVRRTVAARTEREMRPHACGRARCARYGRR